MTVVVLPVVVVAVVSGGGGAGCFSGDGARSGCVGGCGGGCGGGGIPSCTRSRILDIRTYTRPLARVPVRLRLLQPIRERLPMPAQVRGVRLRV